MNHKERNHRLTPLDNLKYLLKGRIESYLTGLTQIETQENFSLSYFPLHSILWTFPLNLSLICGLEIE